MIDKLIDYTIYYLTNNWVVMLKKALLALVIFIIVYIIAQRFINKIKKRIQEHDLQTNSEYSKKLANLIWKILFIIAMIFNVLIIFEVIGIDVALLMAWLSLGIWFSMETMIANVISWLFILTNKKIKIWDYIELLWDFNIPGTIEDINIKHTIIRTIDKRRLLIPNMTMALTPIKTIKSEDLIRWELKIDLPRHINIEQIKTLLNDAINNHDNILNKNYTKTFIREFNAKWYKFHTIFFLNPKNWTPFIVSSDIREKLSHTLKKYGIDFPYEHIVIDIEN